jgi:transcriptional regulator with XRE-family HTH domain
MDESENKLTFGEFIQERRSQLKISLRKFAEKIDVSAMYISQIESGNKAAPENEMLDKIIKGLQLSPQEQREAYDLAASERRQTAIAQDARNYIMENPIIVHALRTAKDEGVGIAEWEQFIEDCKSKNKH